MDEQLEFDFMGISEDPQEPKRLHVQIALLKTLLIQPTLC